MPAKHILFDAKTWNGKFPEPFDSFTTKGISSTSVYNTTGGKVNLHPTATKALIAYCDMLDSKGNHAMGSKPGEYVCAEYYNEDDNETYAVLILENGKVMASTIKSTTSGISVTPYNVVNNGRFGTAVHFAAIALFKNDPKNEFNEILELFYEEYKKDFSDEISSSELAAKLTDNMYRRVIDDNQDGGVKIEIAATGNIPQIAKVAVESGTYAPTDVTNGEFTYLKPAKSTKTRKKQVKPNEFIGQHKLSERVFSEFESDLIPKLESWYVIPHEVVTVCKHLTATTGSNNPMRNIMLRGPAGTGKTEGAKAIAAGLNLPYMHLTCSANTEVFDLVGQIIPKLSKDGKDTANGSSEIKPSDVAKNLKLPSDSDIMMDPVFAYEVITGIFDESKTEIDCYKEMFSRISTEMNHISESSGKEFEYIDTPLVKALKNGYVCELQEPTVIMQPGVLVGLNSLLDNCGNMLLPTGERLVRHPDAVIVVTTNISYEGCRNLNQSFISRMNMIMDIDEPTKAVKIKRIKNITNFTDDELLKKMVETGETISEYCKEQQITDGTCGMRELISWAQSTMVLNDPQESALYTIIAASTSDSESRRDIISSCLEPVFGRVS